ncbi:transcriptional regulator [Citrobacter sp. wls710]|nr:transcriptional regulator [Citrobacter sp. wls710]
MRAEGTACMDAGSAPTRQADGIRRITRAATIFPPRAWDAREAAGSLPCMRR